VRLLFRPIDEWPTAFTTNRKTPQFSATWSDTLEVLERELTHLGASEAVIKVAADERAMRLDGGLRADAKVSHPGVILSFETKKYGPMRYFTDVFGNGSRGGWNNGTWGTTLPGWQMNARAIALGLEALRKVDRYGITKRGEQYTGWSALPPAAPMGAAKMTLDEAAEFISQHAGNGWSPGEVWNEAEGLDQDALATTYRLASKQLHPDAGGTKEDFQKLQEAKRLLDEALS
jgi:hypothetical protein